MAAQYHSLFTTQGLALLREAIQTGAKLGITHMAYGDGNGMVPTPNADFTKLVKEVYRTPLNRLAPSKENTNWLEADGVIPSAVGGFNIREVGLYAGNVLVAYANYPPTYKPRADQGTAQIKTIRIVLQIDNTANFELKIDASVVMATIQSVEEAKNEAIKYADSTKITHIECIEDLDLVEKWDGRIVYIESYYRGLDKGASTRFFDSSREKENDGFICIKGWVLKLESSIFTPHMSGCKCDGITDDTLNFDKLMYALEKNKLKGKVLIEDDMFFNSQCPRVGKLIDPVQFNEKNAIRLVSNVDLEINATLKFGSFYAGTSEQPRCNLLSAMYRKDINDWYGSIKHENIKVFGTGTLDFTETESATAPQDGYRWIIKASVDNMEVYGLMFKGGDFANAIQTSKTSTEVRVYKNKFINLMSDKSLLHDHSTVYCIGKRIYVYDNYFEFNNIKGRLNSCACELHGSNQWFYSNTVVGYPNLVFSAILRTDQSLDENEIVYDQKVFSNTAQISRSALGYWSIPNKTAKLNDLDFYNNMINFISSPTREEYASAQVNGLSYPNDLNVSVFTVWHEGNSIPNINYSAEIVKSICIRNNIITAEESVKETTVLSLIRFVGSYVRQNLQIIDNILELNCLLNRDVDTLTTNDYLKGWKIKGNKIDFSKHKNRYYSFYIFLEYMQDCEFDFDFHTKFPTLDPTYSLLNFNLRDTSKVIGNNISIKPNKSFRVLDKWLDGTLLNLDSTKINGQFNKIDSVCISLIEETKKINSNKVFMNVRTGNMPIGVNSANVITYESLMFEDVAYPMLYSIDFSHNFKLKANYILETNATNSEIFQRFAYLNYHC